MKFNPLFVILFLSAVFYGIEASGQPGGSPDPPHPDCPQPFTFSGAGTFCGSTTLTLSGSDGNHISYQLRLNGGSDVGSPVVGTGSSLTWNVTTSGLYAILATNPTINCSVQMPGLLTVTINPVPLTYDVSGGGVICNDGSTASINLSGSENSVSYQLRINGVDEGSPRTGNGSPLSWTGMTNNGPVTILGTRGSCTQSMSGNISISINQRPAEKSLSIPFSSYCVGTPGPTLSLASSQSGINYQLRKDGIDIGSQLVGDGTTLTWSNLAGGLYTVMATDATTGCFFLIDAYNIAVTEKPAPVIFNVTGVGSICTGVSNASVSLSSSEVGVNYQLKLNGANTGAPVAGTGAQLNWTNITTAGAYSILATSSGSCTTTMNGALNVSVNAIPTYYSITGSGAYCEGSAGRNLGLGGSEVGVNYQLKKNGADFGVPLAGTGSTLTWPNQTVGTYDVLATNTTTGCNRLMNQRAITMNPAPASFLLSGGGQICSGGSTSITMQSSEVGVTYQLRRNGSATQTAQAGTGATIVWTNLTLAATYTVLATRTSTSCTKILESSVGITVNPLPTNYTLGGSTNYCEINPGVTITLSSSQAGVTYQLQRDGVNIDVPKAGGTALSWPNQTAGIYNVLAVNTTTGCSRLMTTPRTVIVTPLPQSYTVGGDGPICTGATAQITLNGSETGVNYQLKRNTTSNIGTALAGNGGTLTWNASLAGTYTVVATRASITCSKTMNGSTVVSFVALPTDYIVSGGGNICTNNSNIKVTLNASQSGMSYQLVRDGVSTGSLKTGTGASLEWSPITESGTYTVAAQALGCSRVMTGSAVARKVERFYLTGNGFICPGGSTILTLSGSQTNIAYLLVKNGVSTDQFIPGTGDELTFTVSEAGQYMVGAFAPCGEPMINMIDVQLQQPPDAYVNGPTTLEGSKVILTATEGPGYQYQWMRDGVDIQYETYQQLEANEPGQYQVKIISAQGCQNISAEHALFRKTKYYNGIIAATSWRTGAAAFQTSGQEQGEFNGVYAYDYDSKYQLTDARFGTATATGVNFEGNRFRLSNLSYDANGNIQSLTRFDANAMKKNDFAYEYNSQPGQQTNKLESIPGYSNYSYDAKGQLIAEEKTDGTENSKYIEYDVSGKVRKVFTSQNTEGVFENLKVEYVYDDRGFRLAKVNYETNRTTWYIRNASGTIISTYEQEGISIAGTPNENPIIQTEVPLYGGGKLGSLHPADHNSVSYELTDHLGNVRALVRDNHAEFVATMEDTDEYSYTNPRVREITYFENISETEDQNIYMNHTPADVVPNPNKAAYLHWIDGLAGQDADDKAMGPAISLKVNEGDVIEIETWARFERKANFARDLPLLALSGFVGQQFVGGKGFEALPLEDLSEQINSGLAGFGYPDDESEDQVPFAYLNYMIFDDQQNMINAGWKRVGDDAGFYTNEMGIMDDHEHLTFGGPITIDQKGFIYIWVSNQSEDARVWFDDLTVKFSGTFVSQATDYGPWGEVLREQKSDESIYRFGYQGQFAEKDEETGWNHFDLREYDPIVGRWTSVDPEIVDWSPYVGMGNNPIFLVDPDGADPCPGGPCPKKQDAEGVYYQLPEMEFSPSGYESFDAVIQAYQAPGYLSSNPDVKYGDYSFTDEQNRMMAGYLMDGAMMAIPLEFAIVGSIKYLQYAKWFAKYGKVARGLPALRLAYVAEVKGLSAIANKMRAVGNSAEEIARTLHGLRRQLGEKYKALTPDDLLQQIYERNLKKYGDKLGPTIEYLRQQGKSWDDIIESATRTGGKDLGF